MKRKNAALCGNLLMGLGLVIMVGGIAYAVLSQVSNLGMPDFFTHGAVMSIFIGALLWLTGARVGGREAVADRYYWVRHYDARCRKNHRHS
ncbi:stress-induced protein YchH [Rouxiella badensis]|uniref:stress-induced protein YchH n=1 Tax=Rouxiella badensis TaxID=1646377 RepID=UPI001D1484F0|nr:stress-induced protein YchH [Rouxiella badensis]MCC3705164.1 stress-induced protein YchH [Rouxiella badensis]